MAVTGATARPAAEPQPGALTRRTLSSLVLAPPVVAAVYFGAPFFEILVAAAAVVLAWEWARICTGGKDGVELPVLVAALLAAIVTATAAGFDLALVALAGGAVAVFAVGAAKGRADASETPSEMRGRRWWLAAGVPYIGLPCVAFMWLRADPSGGRETTLWLLVVVWAVDVGAYAAGRLIGGPRLAPVLSPKKTWAGLIGGIVCAGAAGAATAAFFDWRAAGALAAAAAALGLVAQAGDLAESWVKRRFRVKDASALIPGHGGLLDRVDGLLAATVATALFRLLEAGEGVS